MANQMMPMQFKIKEIESEMTNLAKTAAKFLDNSTTWTLRGSIEGLKNHPKCTWRISQKHSLKTVVSDGRFERSGKSERTPVYGTLSFLWQISDGKDPKSFMISGNASTEISIRHGVSHNVLAKWHFDVASKGAPGSAFHVQIENPCAKSDFFKQGFPVPRFDSILITPMDALDFLLGELWQDEWKKVAMESNSATDIWGTGQRERLETFLNWKLKRVSGCTGSAWAQLKSNCPFDTDSGLIF